MKSNGHVLEINPDRVAAVAQKRREVLADIFYPLINAANWRSQAAMMRANPNTVRAVEMVGNIQVPVDAARLEFKAAEAETLALSNFDAAMSDPASPLLTPIVESIRRRLVGDAQNNGG